MKTPVRVMTRLGTTLLEPGHVGRLHPLQLLAGHRGEGDRDVLGPFGPALGRHHDLLLIVAAGRRLCRGRLLAEHRKAAPGDCAEDKLRRTHGSPGPGVGARWALDT